MRKKTFKKIGLLLAGLAVVALFRYFDLGQYLSLAYLKESQLHFSQLYGAHRFTVIAAYTAIYIVVTALSLPGAVIMTLAGGALFGLGIGAAVVSVASTIGASLACLASRYLLRDWVQARFGKHLTTINKGIEKEGPFYLFTVRLIPVFPFFLINLLMGLTRMRLTTFFWVSQIGMLPGTMVYVNAGKELAKINSPGDILSPGLLFSFALLGLFPLAIKKIVPLYRRKSGPGLKG
jgi:uncharacterized membrane protein YdjX (TVP38/TMEM64 family)